MEAAKLVRVPDSISRGESYLPSAGTTSGQLPHGTAPAGPTPVPDHTKGLRELDKSILAASHNVSNGQGREYDGSADNDEDDVPLNSKGNGSTGTTAANEI